MKEEEHPLFEMTRRLKYDTSSDDMYRMVKEELLRGKCDAFRYLYEKHAEDPEVIPGWPVKPWFRCYACNAVIPAWRVDLHMDEPRCRHRLESGSSFVNFRGHVSVLRIPYTAQMVEHFVWPVEGIAEERDKAQLIYEYVHLLISNVEAAG